MTMDPTTALTAAIDNATKVANTPLFTTVIDKLTGFKLSDWAAEGELRKRMIHDEYEKAKQNGISGIQYISSLRQTTNLIDTAIKSTEYIDSDKENEIKMDNDFFWNTIEYSKSISDEKIQELIAKIIAGEYNTPGTYSMSTLHSIKMLGKNELELFEKIASLLINNKEQIPKDLFAIPADAKAFMHELKIDFGSLGLLQNLGLFLSNSMTQTQTNPRKEKLDVTYFDKVIRFEPSTPENENSLTVQLPEFYRLSPVGKQLLKHVNRKYNDNYFIWLKKNYKLDNYQIVETKTE